MELNRCELRNTKGNAGSAKTRDKETVGVDMTQRRE
jgi:hypothetical protein